MAIVVENFLKKFLRKICSRVKEKLDQLPCDQFLQVLEISRSFLRAKQVGEKRGRIQNPVKIAHKAAVLFFLSL